MSGDVNASSLLSFVAVGVMATVAVFSEHSRAVAIPVLAIVFITMSCFDINKMPKGVKGAYLALIPLAVAGVLAAAMLTLSFVIKHLFR